MLLIVKVIVFLVRALFPFPVSFNPTMQRNAMQRNATREGEERGGGGTR